jgi:hypothetical protein
VVAEEIPLPVEMGDAVRTIEPVSKLPAIVVIKVSGTVDGEASEMRKNRKSNVGKPFYIHLRGFSIDNQFYRNG